MRTLLPAAVLLAAALGCGKPEPTDRPASTSAARKTDAKSLLQAMPVDHKSFEAVVLGRSTREITDVLGPPKQVLNARTLGWVYSVPADGSSVILLFRDDKVIQVDW